MAEHGNVSRDHKAARMGERRRGPLSSVNNPQPADDGLDVTAGGPDDTPEGNAGPTQRKHRLREPLVPARPPSAPQPPPINNSANEPPIVLVPSSSAADGELSGDHISDFPSQVVQNTHSVPTGVAFVPAESQLSYASSEGDGDVAMGTSPDDVNLSGCICGAPSPRSRSSPPPPSFPARSQESESDSNPESWFIRDLYTFMNWTGPRVAEIEENVSKLRSLLSNLARTLSVVQDTMSSMKEQQHTSCAAIESAVSGLDARATVLQTAVNDLRRQNPPQPRPPHALDNSPSPPVHVPAPPPPTPALVSPPSVPEGRNSSSNPPANSLTLEQVERELSQPGISPNRKKNVIKRRNVLLELVSPEVRAWAARQDAARADGIALPPPTTSDPRTPNTSMPPVTTTPAQAQPTFTQAQPTPAPTVPTPPTHGEDTSWSTVAAKNANKPLTLKARRVASRDDSNLWIIRFTDSPPREEQRMTDRAMWSVVNSIDKSVYGFEALSVNWSGRGKGPSIMIRFSGTTIAANIDTHSAEIRRRLAHGKDIRTITLTKNVRCSKVVVTGIPCTDPLNGDAPYTIARVTEEMSKNPLFERLKFVSQPHWLTEDLESKTFGNVAFVFEDPDGSYTDDLISHYFYLFGKQCLARVWRDKIDITQCDVCWRWGVKHTSCRARCRLCGANDHQEGTHFKFCRECVSESATEGSNCAHPVCAGCKQAHPANYEECDAKAAAIKRIRDQNAARYQAQTSPLSGLSRSRQPSGLTRH